MNHPRHLSADEIHRHEGIREETGLCRAPDQGIYDTIFVRLSPDAAGVRRVNCCESELGRFGIKRQTYTNPEAKELMTNPITVLFKMVKTV